MSLDPNRPIQKGSRTWQHTENPNRDGRGFTRAEIAIILGISEERVGQLERRALEKMRRRAPQWLSMALETEFGS